MAWGREVTEKGMPVWYCVRIKGFASNLVLLEEADDLVSAVMKATEHVSKLNDAMRAKFPGDIDDEDEFCIEAIHRTEMAMFTEDWMRQFVDGFSIHEEEQEEDN